jgi:hypothetical protein
MPLKSARSLSTDEAEFLWTSSNFAVISEHAKLQSSPYNIRDTCLWSN